jgi:hypothetical protein
MLNGLPLFVVLMSLAGTARSELLWEKLSLEVQCAVAAKEVTLHFPFQNTGNSPISIVDVTESCGSCTSATIPEKPILPGEKGALPVRFAFGDRRGMQTKSLSVMTDDMKTTRLSFKCLIIDEPVSLLPSSVYWKVGEKAEAKTVDLAILHKDQIKIIAVASTDPKFTATLTAIHEGETYALNIKPKDTVTASSAQVFVQTNYPMDGPKAYSVRVQIH